MQNVNFVNNSNILYTGGFVRDLILANPHSIFQISNSIYKINCNFISKSLSFANDIDIATTLPPVIVSKIIDTSFPNIARIRKFATSFFEIDGKKIEITSTRVDKECDGKNAKMKFGVSFYKDSFRRDFTFNALYMAANGTIFDFHNGVNHLMNGDINFIGEPKTRICEDYTRIKRYYNFSKRFNMHNFEIENAISYIMKNSKKPITMR